MSIVKTLKTLAVDSKSQVIITEDTDIYVELMKNGQDVTFFCMNYFYTGKITGVNGDKVILEGTRIIYETGSFGDSKFKDAQSLGAVQWFINMATIESFGILPKK